MSVQAWPEEHDALDIQPTRSCSVESQTPSQWEERGTSAAADDEPSHPHTELQVRMLMARHLLLKQLSRLHT